MHISTNIYLIFSFFVDKKNKISNISTSNSPVYTHYSLVVNNNYTHYLRRCTVVFREFFPKKPPYQLPEFPLRVNTHLTPIKIKVRSGNKNLIFARKHSSIRPNEIISCVVNANMTERFSTKCCFIGAAARKCSS